VGQDYAKKTIADAWRALSLAAYEGPIHIKKSNLLPMGPTGSGKTYTMQSSRECSTTVRPGRARPSPRRLVWRQLNAIAYLYSRPNSVRQRSLQQSSHRDRVHR